MLRDYNEAEALKMLAEGEESAKIAFRQLYDEYAESIYSTARQFLESSEVAKDLVQEIFITIWLRRKEFTGVNHFHAYLYGMTKNFAINHLRKMAKKAFASQEFTDRQILSSNNAIDHYDALLQEVIAQLPPQGRQVYHLAKVEGFSYDHIAQQLNISPTTVNTHMTRALKFIRKRLQKVEPAVL